MHWRPALRGCNSVNAASRAQWAAAQRRAADAYVVRENRDDAASKEASIHVAVVPALRLQPKADPLFILSGGPGQAASDFYLSMAPAFARIRRDRDIVLVDQRGTGRSNRLDCDLPDDGELCRGRRREAALRPLTLASALCRAIPASIRPASPYAISMRSAPPLATNRSRSMACRTALESRSTTCAVIRQRVRTAILDGVVPAEMALGPDIAPAAQRALDATFARCAADLACDREFPDISARFSTCASVCRRALSKPPLRTR